MITSFSTFHLHYFTYILDICHTWYHARCVKLGRVGVQSVDKYHCPRCESMCGPSVMKPKTNDHRCVMSLPTHTYQETVPTKI